MIPKVYNIGTGYFARTRNILFHENQFHNFERDHEGLTFSFKDENLSTASSLNLQEKGSKNDDADTTTTNNESSDDDRMEDFFSPYISIY